MHNFLNNPSIFNITVYFVCRSDEMEERLRSKEMVGKVLISEESGKKFGVVGDIDYIIESGELINLVLVEPTPHASELNLREDDRGRILVPFSAVKSVGDFIIVSESDII
jgi:sporulation protein YlmC with PRC-barrel domain